jgi:hypothetical protein
VIEVATWCQGCGPHENLGTCSECGHPIEAGTHPDLTERLERVGKLAAWIERDRREPDKVIAYAQELARIGALTLPRTQAAISTEPNTEETR